MTDDLELCLEVQVDPISKKVLSNPEKCRSTLLDVTVVKPKEMETVGRKKTNTLRAHEVRKLISSLEKQRRKKQKVLDNLKHDDTIIQIRKHEHCCDCCHFPQKCKQGGDRVASSLPVDDLERKDFIGIAESVEPLFCEIKRSLKNVETRINNMQGIDLAISQTTVDEMTSQEYLYSKRKNRSRLTNSNGIRNHSVYRVETNPHNLKAALYSNNKQKLLDQLDKTEGKCLCENCGIVGLLTECQKHPLLPELSDSLPPSTHKQLLETKKKTRFNILKNADNAKTDDANEEYVMQLNDRVKMLEQRLALQEERLVPKDYFKKIISKMVTNFSPRLFKSKSDTSLHFTNENKKRVISEKSSRHRSPRSDKTSQSRGIRTKEPKTATKKDQATSTEDNIYPGGYTWKWGEEILKPGVDLKNKIVTLLNEMIGKLSLNETKSTNTPKCDESVKSDDCDSETIKKFMKYVSTKVYSTHVDINSKLKAKDNAEPEETLNSEHFHHPLPIPDNSKQSRHNSPVISQTYQLRRVSEKNNKKIDVSYVNPKLSFWKSDSPDVKKAEDRLPEQMNQAFGKQEFLKIVSKAKQHQKDILWKNIWNQAKANGQTENDVITIKIPYQMKDNKGKPRMLETEISIGEVEKILKGIQ